MDHVSITLLIEEKKLLPMHYLMGKYEYDMKWW